MDGEEPAVKNEMAELLHFGLAIPCYPHKQNCAFYLLSPWRAGGIAGHSRISSFFPPIALRIVIHKSKKVETKG